MWTLNDVAHQCDGGGVAPFGGEAPLGMPDGFLGLQPWHAPDRIEDQNKLLCGGRLSLSLCGGRLSLILWGHI